MKAVSEFIFMFSVVCNVETFLVAFNVSHLPVRLGYDHRYKILLDGDDFLNSPLGPFIEALFKRLDIGTESIYPLTGLPVLGLPRYIPSFVYPTNTPTLYNQRRRLGPL